MKCTQDESDELYNIFAQVQEVDEQIYYLIIEMLRKENISDCIGFLSSLDNQKYFYEQLNLQKKIKLEEHYISNTINIIKQIQDHDFNKQNYSDEIYTDLNQNLINKISQDQNIIQFLKFLVHLTAIDNSLIQCGSNSLHLLVEMKADLRNTNFENIKIQNKSLVGANFVRCNLSGSQFENLDISGINLNGAILFNYKWKNIKIHELNKLVGHSYSVNSVCFSPDGNTLASGSSDKSIRLWDVKTGQQKSQLDGHSNWVYSVYFSTDGNTLASRSGDKPIRLWDVKTGREIQSIDNCYKYILAQFKTHYFKAILSEEVLVLILQYYLYPKHQHFKLKVLQSFKENLQIIKVQIYCQYQNQKEVVFCKTNQNQNKRKMIIVQFHEHYNQKQNIKCFSIFQ